MVRTRQRRLSPRAEFPSTLRSTRLTSQLGVWLGIAFGVCLLTGLVSHAMQHPASWFAWPSRPVWLYRVTQGVHVATGLATVPLLGAKLWSVYPRLFTWPPVRGLVHAAERASVAVLVASALFQVVTGVLNVSRWYTPMGFFFTTAHYWTAWLVAGAILLHVAVKLPVVREALAARSRPADPAATGSGGGLSRRGLLGAVATGAAAITVATIGQTVAPLSRLSLLAPREPRTGPANLPVNTSAQAAGVIEAASDRGYRLRLSGPAGTRMLSRADLAALPRHTAALPITCVEGWSADAEWAGVRIADLVTLAGVPAGEAVRVRVDSLQRHSRYATSMLEPPHVWDPLTLLALEVNGAPLGLDHGYPARLIAPDRPGVLQTKWVAAVTVVAG